MEMEIGKRQAPITVDIIHVVPYLVRPSKGVDESSFEISTAKGFPKEREGSYPSLGS